MGKKTCSDQTAPGFTPSLSGRRRMIKLLGLSLTMPLVACNQTIRKEVWLNVEMFSYVDRPIHAIFFNGTHLGVMNSYGSTGTITSVRIPFGNQTLRWTLGGPEGQARNGEQVQIKNTLVILPGQITPETRYLGLHLYPDDTGEITFSPAIPDLTDRGEKILAAARKQDA